MNKYTYNDVSWRVFGEINKGTVAVKFLNAKEAHRWPLTFFLGDAMGVMNYTCKPGPITYTIAETEEGYDFQMDWETTLVKAQTIQEYTELLKGTERPVPGKTEWRAAIAHRIEALLGYSSQFTVGFTAVEGTALAQMRMEAKVKFSSLVSAPHIPRLYTDGPQRQVSIFDLFEYQSTQRYALDMEFVVGNEHELAVRISVPGKHAELTLGDRTIAHKNLVRFLQAIHNIIHSVEEKVPVVNVATMRTSRFYDEEYEDLLFSEDDDEDPWPCKAEVLHTRYVHYRDDRTHCSMDIRNLHGWGATFNILIREGADLVLEDDWFYRNSGRFIQHSGYKAQPTRAQLEAPVQLAFTADDHDLRNAVCVGLAPFLDHFGAERYKEIYKADPPFELLGQI